MNGGMEKAFRIKQFKHIKIPHNSLFIKIKFNLNQIVYFLKEICFEKKKNFVLQNKIIIKKAILIVEKTQISFLK